MSPASDAESVLSAVPASIPAIGAGITGLVHAGVASGAPFLIEGRRCTIDGSRRGTDTRVGFGAGSVVRAVDAELGPAVNVVQTPGLLRRERTGPRGSATETLLAVPSLPLAVVQWTGAPGSLPEQLRIVIDPSTRVEADGDGAGTDPRSAPGVVLRTHDDRFVAIACAPAPARIEWAPDGRSVVFAMPPVAANGPAGVTLVVACGTPPEVRAAIAASAHVPAHAVRAAMPVDDDGMVLETGVPEIDDGFAWARVRLRGIAARLGDAPPSRRLAAGLAALAAGDEESARAALAALPVGRPEHAFLAARTAATLGDPTAALAAMTALMAGRDSASEGSARPPDSALLAVAGRALADGLRYAAPESVITALRHLGEAVGSAAAVATEAAGTTRSGDARGRRLPMAGRPPGSPKAPITDPGGREDSLWLSRLLEGTPDVEPPAGTGTAMDCRRAAAAFVSDPDAGWTLWRQALTRGLADGPAGPCSWDGPPGQVSSDESCATAELILAVTQGLLGTAPDAPVGRLTLAPRLPSHLRSFLVRGIPLGEARLSMAYQRVGTTHRFTLMPEIAAVPPLIVFEPAVPGDVVATRVDGEAADLDLKPAPKRGVADTPRTIVPVQLPLDDLRIVEIDVRAATP